MLSLEAVLRHPALRGMRCVAGQSGLARNVANVAFLDYEPTQGSYDNFYKDELVLSTMLFAQGQPALAWQAMEGLMRRGGKDGVSARVSAACVRHGAADRHGPFAV